ncbi:DUF362 domain-containing protein [bacterium]|nr:DUF362 domain-containing protein [bacterium]
MFNRRAFLKGSAALGALGAIKPVFARDTRSQTSSGYFNVHPFVEEHPEAVFIMRTNVDIQTNYPAKKEEGLRFARSVMLPVDKGGIPLTHMIPIKPNLTDSMWDMDGFTLEYGHGIVTDPYFVEGIIEGMKELGFSGSQFYIREVNGPRCFEPRMYTAMCKRTGADIRDLSEDARTISKDKIHWTDVPNGKVHMKIPHLWPINAPDTFFLNIGKLKNNMNGITLVCKNHQGSIANRYQRFCQGIFALEKYSYENLVPKAKEDMEASFKRHVQEGIMPNWARGYDFYGSQNTSEIWCHRTVDNVSSTKMGLCIGEAIHSREGCFYRGPNSPLNNTKGLTEARDFMTNFVIFGKDAVLVDSVGTWIAGHEPGNFGFFNIALERGLTTVIDPRKIPVYSWEDGAAHRVQLTTLQRYPIRSNYIPKKEGDSNRANVYYLYDEPFDYGKVSETVPKQSTEARIRVLDNCLPNPTSPFIALEYVMPADDYAFIDIYNSSGDRIDRILRGFHQAGPGCAVWNISKFPAGTYSAVLQLRDGKQTAPVVLRA